MKSVGLVTLFERNYGSALQCYAVKRTVEKIGYNCDVIAFSTQGVDRITHFFNELLTVVWRSIRYRGYIADYRSIRSARLHYSHSLSKQSAKALWLFKESVLQARECSESTLRQMGGDEQYICFITGSDQVWNGHKSFNPDYFLRFTPEEKRISLAASFGADSVPSYNKKRISKFLAEIPALSVREEAGARLVKELTGREAELLPDPTVLFSGDEWRKFAVNGYHHTSPYLFAHFIDDPSPSSVKEIEELARENHLDVLVFGYPHASMTAENGFRFMDGGVEDYISMIDSAEMVCTDSFHSALFSINLSSKFAVYHRNYRHAHPQTSRIETLLQKYDYQDRIITDATDARTVFVQPLHDCAAVLHQEREKILAYLHTHIPAVEKGETPQLKDQYDCIGCGVCAEVCPSHAITMQFDKSGSHRPVINPEKCTHCGACEKACHREIPPSDKLPDAFIAYNTDEEIARQSASGGIFSALAAEVLRQGGVVYGAALVLDAEGARVVHREVDKLEELSAVLGSKYAQSDIIPVLQSVRTQLKQGKTVLFGGTSCQVDALYRFLGSRDFENLYTLDLICHGVPGQKLLADYVDYLGHRKKDRIKSLSFRTKRAGAIQYEITAAYEKSGTVEVIPKLKSSYYRLFMSMNSYRDCCYHCKYASLCKPADVTAGDYFEIREDYPEIYEKELKGRESISSLLVRTPQGRKLIARFGMHIHTISADARTIQSSHSNLRKPSRYTTLRSKFLQTWQQSGFEGVERYFQIRDALLYLPKKLLRKGEN